MSRSLLDYEGNTLDQLNAPGSSHFTLDDWWEEQYQTERIENITYGTVGDAGAYGIGSKIKSLRSTSYTGDDDQWSNGGYFIVGESGTSIGRFTNAWESRSYNYYPGIIDYYTELDYGLISNTPTTINDCGSITVGVVNESVDHGHIWKIRPGISRNKTSGHRNEKNHRKVMRQDKRRNQRRKGSKEKPEKSSSKKKKKKF